MDEEFYAFDNDANQARFELTCINVATCAAFCGLLLCFVLDTSASMNQKTVQGQRLIDHAKTAIENFISKVMTHTNYYESLS